MQPCQVPAHRLLTLCFLKQTHIWDEDRQQGYLINMTGERCRGHLAEQCKQKQVSVVAFPALR